MASPSRVTAYCSASPTGVVPGSLSLQRLSSIRLIRATNDELKRASPPSTGQAESAAEVPGS